MVPKYTVNHKKKHTYYHTYLQLTHNQGKKGYLFLTLFSLFYHSIDFLTEEGEGNMPPIKHYCLVS